jgi:probable F420-dependent oxidoreductase
MTPMFSPPAHEWGAPPVHLAAVGPAMTRLAGEVADGLLVHGFTTERYLREVTMPALARGLERAGKRREDFQVSCPVFMVTGASEQEIETAERGVREQLAFYGSTPAYRPVLELHGWGELQTELNALSKQGQWQEMGRRIDDDVLAAFAIRGEPEEIPKLVLERYGDVMDRISFYAPYRSDPERWRAVLALFKSA